MRRRWPIGQRCLAHTKSSNTLGQPLLPTSPAALLSSGIPTSQSHSVTPRRLVGNLRQSWRLHRHTTKAYSTKTPAEPPGVELAKPLEEWSARDVQQWLKDSNYQVYADRFAKLTGKQLATLSEEQFRAGLGDPLVGSALYNELQALTNPKPVRDLFVDLHKRDPTLRFMGVADPATPQELPFKERQLEKELLTKAVCRNFVGFKKCSGNTKAWVLVGVTGGSGTGKTRFAVNAQDFTLQEIVRDPKSYAEFLRQQLKIDDAEAIVHDLRMSLGPSPGKPQTAYTYLINMANGDWIPDWERSDTESLQSAFLLTLAAKAFFPRTEVGTIRNELSAEQFANCFTPKAVALALRERYNLGPDQRLTLFVVFDEFQTKVTPDDLVLVAANGNKDGILIRRMALAIMGMNGKMAQTGVHIVPIFCGTLSVSYIGLLPATLYNLVPIPMGPLSQESSIAAVQEVLKDRRRDIPASLIGAMGGIARGLECLVEVVKTWKDRAIDPRAVFGDVVELIKERYKVQEGSPLGRETFKWLVRYCLSGREVKQIDLIPPPNHQQPLNQAGVTLGNLQKDGIIFLARMRKTERGTTYRVVMPLVFAAALNHLFSVFDPQFVTYRPTVGADALEKFARDFEVFKTNLLVDLGETETTFGEKFYGALMSNKLKSRRIRLSCMQACDKESEYFPSPRDYTSVKPLHRETTVNLKEQSVALWIGRKCDVCDNVYSYPGQGQAGEEKKTFIIGEEVKSTISASRPNVRKISPGLIRQEKLNANKAKEVFNEKEFEHFFHFMSNKPAAQVRLERHWSGVLDDHRTMITTKDQFPDRYSPMFAFLALGDGAEGVSETAQGQEEKEGKKVAKDTQLKKTKQASKRGRKASS